MLVIDGRFGARFFCINRGCDLLLQVRLSGVGADRIRD